ncbi:MAG: NADH-quinone oxidoreductase subunit A [Chloroflexota bacterium]
MLIDYVPIGILLILSVGLGVLIALISTLMGPRRPALRKLQPYESGMVPIGQAQRRLPIRFYLTAILFILFDIEIVFFLPWAVVFQPILNLGYGGFLAVEMLVFVIILVIGYIYIWRKGALEWQ